MYKRQRYSHVQMLIGQAGHAAAAGGAGQHTHLHQVGFAHIFQCYTFLTKVGRQGIQAHRTAAVQLNDGTQHAAVQFQNTRAAPPCTASMTASASGDRPSLDLMVLAPMLPRMVMGLSLIHI